VCCRTSRGRIGFREGLHRAQAIVPTLLEANWVDEVRGKDPCGVKQEWLRSDGNRILRCAEKSNISWTRCILPLQGEWYDARARNQWGMPVEEE